MKLIGLLVALLVACGHPSPGKKDAPLAPPVKDAVVVIDAAPDAPPDAPAVVTPTVPAADAGTDAGHVKPAPKPPKPVKK